MSEKELMKYIKARRLMQIATMSGKPWICTVYYAFDGKKLYFISSPNSRHCKDIRKNKHVACAITDSKQKVVGKKVGVQIEGTASQVAKDEEIKRALDLWNKANTGFEKFISMENIKSGKMNDRAYVIKPMKIKFFNENLYGPEGFKVFEL